MDNTDPSNDRLRQSVSQLHSQLAASRGVDDSSRRLMADTLGDLQHPQARSKLEELAVKLDAEHPQLAASVREFVELLGNVGL